MNGVMIDKWSDMRALASRKVGRQTDSETSRQTGMISISTVGQQAVFQVARWTEDRQLTSYRNLESQLLICRWMLLTSSM